MEQQIERLTQEKQMLVASLLKSRVLLKNSQTAIKARNWIIAIMVPLLIIATLT